MNVTLAPELEKLVQEKVASGRYVSPNEVVREALRLLEERDRGREQHLAELREKVRVGVEQLEGGETVPGEQVFEELRQKSRERDGSSEDKDQAWEELDRLCEEFPIRSGGVRMTRDQLHERR